jgi:hypothetical protein
MVAPEAPDGEPKAVARDGTAGGTTRAGSPLRSLRAVGSRSTWEYRELSLPRGTGRDAARAALVEAAELERWELARLRLHPDGHRTVWLRRRILRVARTA